MSSPTKPNWKGLLRWLPGVLISAIALYAVFRLVHIQDFAKALSTASWQFILLVLALQIITLMIRGKAWQTLLGHGVSWKQAFFGESEGYFLNNLFPLRAGEIGRSIFVGRSSGLGMFHALSTIVIERAFDIAMAAILVLLTLPLVVGLAWVKTVALLALVLVIAGLLALFFVARYQEAVSAWVENLGQRWKFVTRYVIPQMNKLLNGLEALTHPVQFLLSLFWIALDWALWVYMYDVLIWQLLPHAPFWNGAFIGSVLALGVAIPSAPAALGVYEASMVAAAVILGGAESQALAYAILFHVIQFIVSGFFGIWGLIRDGQTFSSLTTSLRLGQAADKLDEPENND